MTSKALSCSPTPVSCPLLVKLVQSDPHTTTPSVPLEQAAAAPAALAASLGKMKDAAAGYMRAVSAIARARMARKARWSVLQVPAGWHATSYIMFASVKKTLVALRRPSVRAFHVGDPV